MTTGKILKLVGYLNAISAYMDNGCIIADDNDIPIMTKMTYGDDAHCEMMQNHCEKRSKDEQSIIINSDCGTENEMGYAVYDGDAIYMNGELIENEIRKLSGDVEATVKACINRYFDEYELVITIDNETITVNKSF